MLFAATLSSDARDANPAYSAAVLSLSERLLRKLSDPAVKSEYSPFNSIQLSFLQYIYSSMYFRSDLTSKVHIL